MVLRDNDRVALVRGVRVGVHVDDAVHHTLGRGGLRGAHVGGLAGEYHHSFRHVV